MATQTRRRSFRDGARAVSQWTDTTSRGLKQLGRATRAALHALRRLLRLCLPRESQHLFALTLVAGVVCGLTAVAFHVAIRTAEELLIDRALTAPGTSWMGWTVLTPTLGGLAAGVLLTWVVPGARGSGIPQVKAAYATEGGRVRFRDAMGKFWISTLQIGTGASLGREGPTVQICAGTASLLARATGLPPRHMRRLTPVGVAAGIAAAFNAPIAAVTFTIEEIVGALDNTVLSGVVVAAALAAVIERGVFGVQPVIAVDQSYGLEHASSLLIYSLLGVAAALVSVVFSDGLLRLRASFRKLSAVPRWAHPALGGLVTGLLAVLVLEWLHVGGVTGGGYDTLGRALAGELGFRVLVALCAVKLIATVFSYSSGGAGGIFAPSLFVGAMLGGAFGYLDVLLFGHGPKQLGAFALVGMGAVFAGVIRAPITSVLIIFEMTGGYGLVLPLMLANMTAYALARSLRPEPIYEALLAQDGVVLPRPSAREHILDRLEVADAMTASPTVLRADQTLVEAADTLAAQSFAVAPVLAADGALAGGVPLVELRQALARHPTAGLDSLQRPRTDSTAPRANVTVPSAPELSARSLMQEVQLIAGSASLRDVAEQAGDASRSYLVRLAEGDRVLLSEDLRMACDEHFETVLRAADVAQPAARMTPDSSLNELARALREADVRAAIVYDVQQQPLGIVTRRALVDALLAWFASRGTTACAAPAPRALPGRCDVPRSI